MLDVSLLGTFNVKKDGISLDGLRGRKANRLMALLLLNGDRAVHRDWIETQLEISYDGLRKAESVLRDCLDDERHRLKVECNSLCMEMRGLRIDIVEFEKLIAKADNASLTEAIRLYRGGLLKDWHGAWLDDRREELKVSYLEALQKLAKASTADHQFDTAASLLRRFTQIWPEVDIAWAQLIDAYRLGGNTAEAERTYSAYVTTLQKRFTEDGKPITPSTRVTEALTCGIAVPATSYPECPGISISPDSDSARFEPVGGAVPLDSIHYVRRLSDDLAGKVLEQNTSFILVKGPSQVGKSSLLARLIHQARNQQADVFFTDWQNIPRSVVEDGQSFLVNVAETISEQLHLESPASTHFDSWLPPTQNFERFLQKQVLPARNGWIVWVVDGVDRLFECEFRDDVFGMLRSWHNKRQFSPGSDWARLTIVLGYATEAYLVQNIDQSPFNVGYRFELADFTREQVAELNISYHCPLRNADELDQFYELLGGHPYLVRRSLLEMSLHRWDVFTLLTQAQSERGFLRDHLEKMRNALGRDSKLSTAVQTLLRNSQPPSAAQFVRLCAAGILAGAEPSELRFRCRLYEQYLKRALL